MMWDVSDMRDDVIEHVKVIGKWSVSRELEKNGRNRRSLDSLYTPYIELFCLSQIKFFFLDILMEKLLLKCRKMQTEWVSL